MTQLAQRRIRHSHPRAQHDVELEAQTLDAKIAAVDERLYSGLVKSPKELADLQNRSGLAQAPRTALDDTLLEAMLTLEDAEQATHNAQADLAKLQAEWQATQAT